MIKTNPQLSSFTDKELMIELIYRLYGANVDAELYMKLVSLTREDISNIRTALDEPYDGNDTPNAIKLRDMFYEIDRDYYTNRNNCK